MAGPAAGGDGAIPDTEFIDADEPDQHFQQPLPKNEDPQILGYAVGYIQTYGWFILAVVIVLWYLATKLKPWFARHKLAQEQRGLKKYDALTNQQRNMEAQEAARVRMQEKYDAKAADYAKQQQLKEEAKRQERIDDWDRHMEGRGYRSKKKPQAGNDTSSQTQKVTPKKKEPLRRNRDYNPLMGDSSPSRNERRFRPATGGGDGGGG